MVGIRWELPANQVTNERYPEHFNWGAKTFYPDEVGIVMLLASSVKSPAAIPFSASAAVDSTGAGTVYYDIWRGGIKGSEVLLNARTSTFNVRRLIGAVSDALLSWPVQLSAGELIITAALR